MNALESASLVMIPSGYEDGTLGSLKPTDGSGDFTFSRGSDISATRVNANGYIEKGYENLLLQSNSFLTSSWQLQNGADITPNHSGYDGTNDAWYLYKNTGTTTQLIKQSISSTGVQTFSFYAKAEELEWVRFLWTGSTGGRNHFHLVGDGDFGVGQNIVSRNIEAVGNDWYKCSTTISDSVTSLQIYPASGDNNVSGTTGGIYIQDAMLNQGLVAYPYIETTTAPVAGGILEDMPRLDYSSCPALLLEPSRTNLIRHSEYFGDDLWSGRVQVTPNAAISPEGKNNATLLSDTSLSTTLSYIRALNTSATTIGATYTLSLYVKPKGNSRSFKFWARNTDAPIAFFDLVDGTTSEPSTSTIEATGDGWFRVSSTGQLVSGTLAAYFYVYTDADNVEGFYVYGAQLEQDATYPTSYIPTYGVSQTRLRDTPADLSSPAIAGATQWTLFFDNTNSLFSGAGLMFRINHDSGNYFSVYTPNMSFYNNISGFFGVAGIGKICVKYDGTTFHGFSNGVKVNSTEAIGLGTTTEMKDMGLGMIQKLNKVLFFKTSLTDSECIELTTI